MPCTWEIGQSWKQADAGQSLDPEGWVLRACNFLASYLSFVNVLGSRVSGYDDTSSYHSPANAADPPATSAEPSAAPGSPPAAAGPHASAGNGPSSSPSIPWPLGARPSSQDSPHLSSSFARRRSVSRAGRVGQDAASVPGWSVALASLKERDPAKATRVWAWRVPHGLRLRL